VLNYCRRHGIHRDDRPWSASLSASIRKQSAREICFHQNHRNLGWSDPSRGALLTARTTGWPRLRFFCAPIWRRHHGHISCTTKHDRTAMPAAAGFFFEIKIRTMQIILIFRFCICSLPVHAQSISVVACSRFNMPGAPSADTFTVVCRIEIAIVSLNQRRADMSHAGNKQQMVSRFVRLQHSHLVIWSNTLDSIELDHNCPLSLWSSIQLPSEACTECGRRKAAGYRVRFCAVRERPRLQLAALQSEGINRSNGINRWEGIV
jgi:hypothetical protein